MKTKPSSGRLVINNNNSTLQSTTSESQKNYDASYALYVIEAVELNIVLSCDDSQIQYSYPVHLYPVIPFFNVFFSYFDYLNKLINFYVYFIAVQ